MASSAKSSPSRNAAEATGAGLSIDAAVLKAVPVTLQAKLGEVRLSVAELLALREGSVLPLDRQLNDVIELRLNDTVIGRGEIVAVGDRFGVRITEISES